MPKKLDKTPLNKTKTNKLGLEWDKVILHNDFPNLKELQLKILEEKDLNEKAKREFELEQELNLFYVAITRARFELVDESLNLNYRVRNFG